MYDEPDSMLISITVPKNMTDVSNGKLRSIVENTDNTRTFNWFVNNPINNYGVNMNIANYVSWQENYKGEKGDLSLSYFVLPQNLDKAKDQFKQAPQMLRAFEHWFGPYLFMKTDTSSWRFLTWEWSTKVQSHMGMDIKWGISGKICQILAGA
jgi:aminopeptidase N